MKAQPMINVLKLTPIAIVLPWSAIALSKECPGPSAIETIECKQEEWDAAEKSLEIIHNHTTGILIKDLTEVFAPEIADNIRKDLEDSQNHWLEYRKKYCAAYGSLRAPLSSWSGYWTSECMKDAAKARVRELENLKDTVGL